MIGFAQQCSSVAQGKEMDQSVILRTCTLVHFRYIVLFIPQFDDVNYFLDSVVKCSVIVRLY